MPTRKAEQQRRRLGLQLSVLPGVAVVADRTVRLVGLAADKDPEVGLLGVLSLRQAAQLFEEHHVRQARAAGWTWAQIAAARWRSVRKLFINVATPQPPER